MRACFRALARLLLSVLSGGHAGACHERRACMRACAPMNMNACVPCEHSFTREQAAGVHHERARAAD